MTDEEVTFLARCEAQMLEHFVGITATRAKAQEARERFGGGWPDEDDDLAEALAAYDAFPVLAWWLP